MENSAPSLHNAMQDTASRRANATFALRAPLRRAMPSAQDFSQLSALQRAAAFSAALAVMRTQFAPGAKRRG